jgi:L-alanine-DL-glutamate epimerase-like enolase superfamily enzyme
VSSPVAIVIERVEVAAYRVPTVAPESDGTLEWDATTLVVVDVVAGGRAGQGHTYADVATAFVVRDTLAKGLVGLDALAPAAAFTRMRQLVRNLGARGIAAMAISACDVALWDLAAKLLDVPLHRMLGGARDAIPAYGSGGFTSLSPRELEAELAGFARDGLRMVKMKVGRKPAEDVERVRLARRAIGPGVELFVDANGAYDRRQALAFAEAFAAEGVAWFEEPVTSDDLEGLRLVRDRAPAGMTIAAGEYGYDAGYFRRMLAAGAVDVLQADGSRCLGASGLLRVEGLCDAASLPLSLHCAPSLHAPIACALPRARHVEYFADHVRIEKLLFEGGPALERGELVPDPSRPGLGLRLKRKDAERFAVSG